MGNTKTRVKAGLSAIAAAFAIQASADTGIDIYENKPPAEPTAADYVKLSKFHEDSSRFLAADSIKSCSTAFNPAGKGSLSNADIGKIAAMDEVNKLDPSLTFNNKLYVASAARMGFHVCFDNRLASTTLAGSIYLSEKVIALNPKQSDGKNPVLAQQMVLGRALHALFNQILSDSDVAKEALAAPVGLIDHTKASSGRPNISPDLLRVIEQAPLAVQPTPAEKMGAKKANKQNYI